MSAHSCASATISFGRLIPIPVKIYLAAAPEDFSFRLITPEGNPVKQKLVDAETGKEVERAECSRGYEYAKNKFAIFTDEELDALTESEKVNKIKLVEFTSMYSFNSNVEKKYYLAPEYGAEKAYLLLARSLENSSKTAIGKWYTKGREHLISIVPNYIDRRGSGILTMNQLYYANELRSLEYQFSTSSEPSSEELDMARWLINELSTDDVDINKYNNILSERIRKTIDAKIVGSEKEGTSLLSMLQQSLTKTTYKKIKSKSKKLKNKDG